MTARLGDHVIKAKHTEPKYAMTVGSRWAELDLGERDSGAGIYVWQIYFVSRRVTR